MQLAQLTGHPQPVEPERRVNTSRQDQLDGLGRRVLDQGDHVPGRRTRRIVEVIHDDRRPGRQHHRIVGDQRQDISRHDPVHRQQVGGIGAERRLPDPGRLDEPGPEPDRVSVGRVAGQPGSESCAGGAAAQPDSSTLLPAPADPATRVSRWPAPAVSRSCRADLVTSVAGSGAGWNFAAANRAPIQALRSIVAASCRWTSPSVVPRLQPRPHRPLRASCRPSSHPLSGHHSTSR